VTESTFEISAATHACFSSFTHTAVPTSRVVVAGGDDDEEEEEAFFFSSPLFLLFFAIIISVDDDDEKWSKRADFHANVLFLKKTGER